jgi:carbamoyltransferase
MAHYVRRQTTMSNLCLAGGVALNCVANGRVLREVPFQDVWIQPAAGDAGGALGIALAIWHRYLDQPRVSAEKAGTWQSSVHSNNGLAPYADGMKGSYLGPRESEASIERFLKSNELPYKKYAQDQLAPTIAEMLVQGKVIGLHQGRMEFGPRALGGRSIIGDARSAKMQSLMNLKIKYRESFRPFAPSVLREDVGEWFDLDTDSPYMLLVANVTPSKRKEMTAAEKSLFGIERLNVPRSEIPAVTHVDYSARVQTVRRETNPLYWKIIAAFKNLTGCPVIVNTSFNVRGEPIVCTPGDSYRCFMRTEMDVLVLENCVLVKEDQPKFEDTSDWRSEFELD